MIYKWLGAGLILISCSGFGFMLCAAQKREEWMLRQLVGALDEMQCELQYRLTPLPDLCHNAGIHSKGCMKQFLLLLAEELECNLSPDVYACVNAALAKAAPFPQQTRENILQLGSWLGRFDYEGQLKGLEAVRQKCREDIQLLTENKAVRLRSYQTLGICAGVALVILFL